eukprot:1207546-Prymnesium_polylepis.1
MRRPPHTCLHSLVARSFASWTPPPTRRGRRSCQWTSRPRCPRRCGPAPTTPPSDPLAVAIAWGPLPS